jgi:hypothetical protein
VLPARIVGRIMIVKPEWSDRRHLRDVLAQMQVDLGIDGERLPRRRNKPMRKSIVLAVLLVIVLLALVQFGPSFLYGG